MTNPSLLLSMTSPFLDRYRDVNFPHIQHHVFFVTYPPWSPDESDESVPVLVLCTQPGEFVPTPRG
jgi:hypothetical protein